MAMGPQQSDHYWIPDQRLYSLCWLCLRRCRFHLLETQMVYYLSIISLFLNPIMRTKKKENSSWFKNNKHVLILWSIQTAYRHAVPHRRCQWRHQYYYYQLLAFLLYIFINFKKSSKSKVGLYRTHFFQKGGVKINFYKAADEQITSNIRPI